MTYLFDSYAWVEYFSASEAGKMVDRLLKEKKEVYTPSIVVAEVKRKILQGMRAKKATLVVGGQMMEFIKLNSYIVDLDADLAEKAAEIADKISIERKGFGLADGIVLASARKLNAKVVTGDGHFKGLKDVVFIR